MLLLLLFPRAFFLPPGAQAGEIIGGQEAWPHARPYMAFVKIEREGKGGNMCGGFLIREDMVVTVAHCNCNLGLRDKAQMTQTVGTIPLSEEMVKKGAVCSVAGWGQISSKTNSQPSPTLQEVEMTVMGKCMCLSQPYLHYVPSRMLCMGDPLERKAPFLDKSPTYQIRGRGRPCCQLLAACAFCVCCTSSGQVARTADFARTAQEDPDVAKALGQAYY
ncbi:unnamed protein product [Natator depressus]